MAKYSFEFKKQAVQAYLNGKGCYAYLAKKFGMPPGRDIRKWVKVYTTYGENTKIGSTFLRVGPFCVVRVVSSCTPPKD